MAFLARSTASLARLSSTTRATFMRPALISRSLSTQFPEDRKYAKSHEWAKLDGDLATVGISAHAQSQMGDIVFADLPDVGSKAVSGEPAAALESVKTAADVYAPVGGEIVEVNGDLEGDPSLVNSGPYSEGWLFKVKVSDPSDMDGLLDASAYEKTVSDA